MERNWGLKRWQVKLALNQSIDAFTLILLFLLHCNRLTKDRVKRWKKTWTSTMRFVSLQIKNILNYAFPLTIAFLFYFQQEPRTTSQRLDPNSSIAIAQPNCWRVMMDAPSGKTHLALSALSHSESLSDALKHSDALLSILDHLELSVFLQRRCPRVPHNVIKHLRVTQSYSKHSEPGAFFLMSSRA